MDMVVLIFGAALIGATMHIAIGVGERVLVARVALRKQRKRCVDGVPHGGARTADCRNASDASAANRHGARRRRCACNRLVAMAVIGMRSPPPIHYPARRESVSAALWQARGATGGMLSASSVHLLPARGNLAAHASESKLGGFNARFAVSTAYQTQLKLLSDSQRVGFKAL